MASSITITIPGECVPKGRPRFARSGHTYTPQKTKDYEKLVKYHILAQKGKSTDKPVKVTIRIFKSIPKSWSKIKKEDAIKGKVVPAVKPDLDNYVKSILDASNGLLFDDDKQVIEISAVKTYAKMPYAELTVEEVDNG